MCENWHDHRLAAHARQAIDEMKHAQALIERILFPGGTPSLTEPMQLTVGGNVKAQPESNLKLETAAVGIYNRLSNWHAMKATMHPVSSSNA
jgi:bacterioferritin